MRDVNAFKCTDIDMLYPYFMQSELLGMYILLKKNLDIYIPLAMNSVGKQVHKLVLLEYLLAHKTDVMCESYDRIKKSVLSKVPKLTDNVLKPVIHSIEGAYADFVDEYKSILAKLYPDDISKIETLMIKNGSKTVHTFDMWFNNNYFSVN